MSSSAQTFFKLNDQIFTPTLDVTFNHVAVFTTLVQELIDYRLATYEARLPASAVSAKVLPFNPTRALRVELPYFPNLPIACGHFKTGHADSEEHVQLGTEYGRLDPARNFVARASGNSMNGGKKPIHDGDYLLLEVVSPSNAGSITGDIMAIEREDGAGDSQYLLRLVTKTIDGRYILKANNPEYADLEANDDMRTFARFKEIIDPLVLAVERSFMREAIPPLFHETFNPAKWRCQTRTLTSYW